MSENPSTRRKFLQQTGGALAGAALAGAISQRAYAGEDNTIKIALVGCGGRGSSAVREALQTAGPTKLVAVADFFEERASSCIARLVREHLPWHHGKLRSILRYDGSSFRAPQIIGEIREAA